MSRNIWCKVDQEEHPGPGAEHRHYPKDEVDDGHHEQQDQPEPEDDVDLVIDHIDRENAQSIKSTYNWQHLFKINQIFCVTSEYFRTLQSCEKCILSLLGKL